MLPKTDFAFFPFVFLQMFCSVYSQQLQQQNQFGSQQQQQMVNATRECLDAAAFRDCPTFVNCCTRKCPQGQQGHKCMAFMGMIDQGQTACHCPASVQQFGQFPTALSSAGQQLSQFGQTLGQSFGQLIGQQPVATQQQPAQQQWPSAAAFGQTNQASSAVNIPAASSSSSAMSQPQSPAWPSPQASTARPTPFGQQQQNQRPPPGDPSTLRSLFQSRGAGAATSSASSRWQRIGPAVAGNSWWTDFGRRADFVGSILAIFVLDLMLLSLTI